MADLNGAPFTVDPKKGTFTITGTIAKTGKRSASGKSLVFYSTQGNADVGDGFVLGMNLYKKA